jgi:hypothetical protein
VLTRACVVALNGNRRDAQTLEFNQGPLIRGGAEPKRKGEMVFGSDLAEQQTSFEVGHHGFEHRSPAVSVRFELKSLGLRAPPSRERCLIPTVVEAFKGPFHACHRRPQCTGGSPMVAIP